MNQQDIQIDRRAYAQVRRTAAYRALTSAWASPVLLACSGGADSVSLLMTAAIAAEAGRVHPFVVVHVDHGTRPETAEEGKFVAAVASAFGRPFVELELDASTLDGNQGPEAALRGLRYQAVARLADRLGIKAVVTAHTREDQIETILLRLLSGASALASTGMNAVQTLDSPSGSLEIRRPLLGVSRSDLHRTLAILGLGHREDPTNLDLSFRRNRIRQRIVPELEKFDPGFGDGLMRAVELAGADAAVVDRLARDAFEHNVEGSEGTAVIRRSFLRSADTAISTRVVRETVESLLTGDVRELTYERIRAVVDAASGRTGARIELPYGIVAIVERDRLVIGWSSECEAGDE